MPPNSQRLRRAKSGLVVIDIQERLLPAIHEKERVVRNTVRLIGGALALGVPVWVTEQNPRGLGGTILDVARAIPEFAPIVKFAFSACGATGFNEGLVARGLSDIILCGIECHVCVCQTCLDLLDLGCRPFVAADAVSSRTAENCRWGLERMRDGGAVIVSTEVVLFELVERADAKEFKVILSLVK